MNNVTRIAPTPNGHLHLGNIFNFLHTYVESKRLNARLGLRIDDHDYVRCKEKFVDEIFIALDVLRIPIDFGPSGVDDFYQGFSQEKKQDYYFEKLKNFNSKFVCECSRKEVFSLNENGIYQGTCKAKKLKFLSNKNVIRYNCPIEKTYLGINVSAEIGDTILWRRDNIVSYQWMSVIDDIDIGTTHFVRGLDLLESSAIQISLARELEADNFKEINFLHHQLVKKDNMKLSKTRNDAGVVEDLKKDPGKYIEMYCDFFGKEKVSSIEELTI